MPAFMRFTALVASLGLVVSLSGCGDDSGGDAPVVPNSAVPIDYTRSFAVLSADFPHLAFADVFSGMQPVPADITAQAIVDDFFDLMNAPLNYVGSPGAFVSAENPLDLIEAVIALNEVENLDQGRRQMETAIDLGVASGYGNPSVKLTDLPVPTGTGDVWNFLVDFRNVPSEGYVSKTLFNGGQGMTAGFTVSAATYSSVGYNTPIDLLADVKSGDCRVRLYKQYALRYDFAEYRCASGSFTLGATSNLRRAKIRVNYANQQVEVWQSQITQDEAEATPDPNFDWNVLAGDSEAPAFLTFSGTAIPDRQ